MYIPPITFSYNYPQVQNEHMMKVVEKYKPVLDENYIYRDKSFGWRFRHFWVNVFLDTLVRLVVVIRYAVKVEGRENLRRNKKLLKNGFVTVSNHVIEWDFLTILHAFFPRKAYFPVWSRNMETPMAPWFKAIGGIPVSTSIHAEKNFIQAMDSVLQDKKWLHVFAEGSMWYFYPAIREFQRGAAFFAIRNKVPIIPVAVSYREPKGIYRLFKKYPNLTVHIGEALFPDPTKSGKSAEQDLTNRARTSVMKMMGIQSEEENQRVIEMFKQRNFL